MTQSTREMRGNRFWRTAAIVFIVAAALHGLATLAQFAPTWDEPDVVTHGRAMLSWYRSGFRDTTVAFGTNILYGGAESLTTVVVQAVTHVDIYTAQHAVCLAFGIAGLAVAYYAGAALLSPLTGFLAAVFLWLTPIYFGYSRNDPKDLPYAVMSFTALACMRWLWDYWPTPPKRVWVPCAVCGGLMLGLRLGGVLTFAYLGLSCAAWFLVRRRQLSDVRAMAVTLVKIGCLAFVVLALCWPAVIYRPLRAPHQALLATKSYSFASFSERFNGRGISSVRTPWTYVPVWFGVTLPDFYAIAALLSPLALWQAVRARRTWNADAATPVFIVVLATAILFPATMFVVFHTRLYDGTRLVLFMVPIFAVLAALSTGAVLQSPLPAAIRGVAAIAIAAALAVTAADMWRLHPYESVYFNRLSGGLAVQGARFDTDYWGMSIREATDWLIAHPPASMPGRIRVANCGDTFQTVDPLARTAELRERFESVHMDSRPDIVVATTRFRCNERVAGRVLYVVERMNAPLCYVIAVDHDRYVDPRVFDDY